MRPCKNGWPNSFYSERKVKAETAHEVALFRCRLAAQDIAQVAGAGLLWFGALPLFLFPLGRPPASPARARLLAGVAANGARAQVGSCNRPDLLSRTGAAPLT